MTSDLLIAFCAFIIILSPTMFIPWSKLKIGDKKSEREDCAHALEKEDDISKISMFDMQEKVKQENLIIQTIFVLTFGKDEKVAEKVRIKAKLIIAKSKGYSKEHLLELLKECESIDADKVRKTLSELEKMENYRLNMHSFA